MSDLLRRPGFDRRYFADTGTHLQPCNTSLQLYWLKQYQPARLAAARYLFRQGLDPLSPDRRGGAGADGRQQLVTQSADRQLVLGGDERDGAERTAAAVSPLLAPDAPAGTLSDAVAALTGLPAATPVAAGALDVCSAALGCGAVNEGYLHDPRHHLLHRDRLPRPADGERGDALCHPYRSRTGDLLFPMQAGMPNIDWLQQHISLDADLGRLEQAIAAVEPGSGGVFWQPYLNGERAPFYSPDARAGFFGISPHTTRAELQRAVFEGLAFAIVDALQGYPQGGELYLTGGGAASATWLQIIADCTGRTVVSSAFNELSARGAAILAACSVAALAETPPLAQTRYQPRPQAHAATRRCIPFTACCASRCCRYGRPDRPPFNLFLRTYNHENRFYRRACWRP